MDLEVIWDGAHRGRDRDLLPGRGILAERMTPRRQLRRQPPDEPEPPKVKKPRRAFFREVGARLQQQPMTAREVAACFGIRLRAAEHALQMLRASHVLETKPYRERFQDGRLSFVYFVDPAREIHG